MRLSEALLITMAVTIGAGCQEDGADSAVSAAEGPSEAIAAAERYEKPTAAARLAKVNGEPVGTATFTETGDGVLIRAEFSSLPSGPHALHIHESGLCEPPDFSSAGDHFRPEGKEHGFNNPKGPHAGDLPNFTADEDGKGSVETLNPRVSLRAGAANSLLKAGGTAIVIHEKVDDYQTDPAGDAGGRIACGVIEVISGE